MDVLVILTASDAANGGLRVFLLLLLLLAVGLVIAGGIIAGLTLYRMVKGQAPGASEAHGD